MSIFHACHHPVEFTGHNRIDLWGKARIRGTDCGLALKSFAMNGFADFACGDWQAIDLGLERAIYPTDKLGQADRHFDRRTD
jgi:hypothetical protein